MQNKTKAITVKNMVGSQCRLIAISFKMIFTGYEFHLAPNPSFNSDLVGTAHLHISWNRLQVSVHPSAAGKAG